MTEIIADPVTQGPGRGAPTAAPVMPDSNVSGEPFPLDPAALAAEIGIPLEAWPGNCHGVATAILAKVPVPGIRLARGHWNGPISSHSVYASGRGANLQQHSWLIAADGRILDPTRWALLGEEPQIYLGISDHYDEGGRQMAAQMPPAFPAPPSPQTVKALGRLDDASLDILYKRVSTAVEASRDERISCLAGCLPDFTRPDPDRLEKAAEVYGILERAGLKSLIPIDSWIRVMEPERLRPRPGANRLFALPPAPQLSDAAKLLELCLRFLLLETTCLRLESELEERGYSLDEWHESLNRLELFADEGLKALPSSDADVLAVVVGDLLGSGFGQALAVERCAASLGLDRQGLDRLIRSLGDRAQMCIGWL